MLIFFLGCSCYSSHVGALLRWVLLFLSGFCSSHIGAIVIFSWSCSYSCMVLQLLSPWCCLFLIGIGFFTLVLLFFFCGLVVFIVYVLLLLSHSSCYFSHILLLVFSCWFCCSSRMILLLFPCCVATLLLCVIALVT